MSTITVTTENYQAEVQEATQIVLMDFWAPWCGPCQMLSPVVEKLADELGEKIKVCKVNVDEEVELARRFSVMGIPLLVVVKNGEIITKSVGIKSKEEIKAMLATG